MPRLEPHKVGLVASVAGLSALLLLDFGSVAAFRIATGEPVGLVTALGASAAVLVVLWVAALALSVTGARSRRLSFARGLVAGTTIVALLWMSGSAAIRLLAAESALARYSMAGGVWFSAFCAFALLIASRREVADKPGRALVLGLVPLVGIVATILSGHVSRLGVAAEYRNVSGDFWIWTGQHIAYSAIAVAIAIVIGIGLGVAAHRSPRIADPIFTVTSVFQTIPGLAMIGILAVPLGMAAESVPGARALGIGVLGWAPVVIALTLYALLAIVRNTYAGLNAVSGSVVEAARGMGLSERQVLRRVQMPLAVPIVFSGIRTATQQTIGTATLGVFVAAGTLGRPIFGGVAQTANDLVVLGSIALVTLAVTTDIVMRAVQRMLTPGHARGAR